MVHYQSPPVEQTQYIKLTSEKGKTSEEIKNEVRTAYKGVAEANNQNSCCGNGRSCCGASPKTDTKYSQELGYTKEEIESAPEGANMNLGCGSPQAIASLKPGEIVLDLGSGGGFDAFLAAKKVGPQGKVFGVDMTFEMVMKARKNATKIGYKNVEFLLGEIEHLPLPNNSVDVVISNCVINLSTDKQQVYNESFRVLKEGGRIAISDVVAHTPLPPQMVNNKDLYCNCIAGALAIDELKKILMQAGFTEIVIEPQEASRSYIKDWVPDSDSENYVVSAKIKATKPKTK
jgi:arsenite methyltransferase